MPVKHLDFRETLAALMTLIDDRVEVLVQHGDARFVVASITGTLSSAESLGEGDEENVMFYVVDGSIGEETYGTFTLVRDEFTGAHQVQGPDGIAVLVTFGTVVVNVRAYPGPSAD